MLIKKHNINRRTLNWTAWTELRANWNIGGRCGEYYAGCLSSRERFCM